MCTAAWACGPGQGEKGDLAEIRRTWLRCFGHKLSFSGDCAAVQGWDEGRGRMKGGAFRSCLYLTSSAPLSGLAFCKAVPSSGVRSLPTVRPALIMLRAYVNPATGVGPSPSALLPFR